MDTVTCTCTLRDPLFQAKDTINWFAGRDLFDLGYVYL